MTMVQFDEKLARLTRHYGGNTVRKLMGMLHLIESEKSKPLSESIVVSMFGAMCTHVGSVDPPDGERSERQGHETLSG